MAPIQLSNDQEQTGCLSSIFASCSRTPKPEMNEKFVYSAIDPMEQLPAYQDIAQVSFHAYIPLNVYSCSYRPWKSLMSSVIQNSSILSAVLSLTLMPNFAPLVST